MQVSSPVPTSTSTSTQNPQTIVSTSNAALTIDPAALLGGSLSSSPATSAPTADLSISAAGANGGTHAIASTNTINNSTTNSIAVKQEPDDEHASALSAPQHTISLTKIAGDTRSNHKPSSASAAPNLSVQSQPHVSDQHSNDLGAKDQLSDQPASLVDVFLQSDHKAILRPDLSAFIDARDVLRRLLPYHVWNIPHHDLLKALDLKEDPVLSQVRLRKRRRMAHLNARKTLALSTTDAPDGSTQASETSVQVGSQIDNHDNVGLNELGLPTPLPEVPQSAFPSLDFTESVFARRNALALRFRKTLTALDTTHKRAPNTSLALEHLERLAYSDDREQVLAQIEELKALKAELETLEEKRQIDVAESSARISLSFGITDEIEREREKERELERIKRQQERAAAKAAKLEKERENRHRLGIFTPPPEPEKTPAPPSPAPASAATPAPPTLPIDVSGPGVPPDTALAMPSPLSGNSAPTSAPGAYSFPTGTNPLHAASMPMSPAGSNGLPTPSPHLGPPMVYASVPGAPFGPAPPFASTSANPPTGPNGAPLPSGMTPMGAPTSALFRPSVAPQGTPSTPAATPTKPLSKAKAKAAAAAASAGAAIIPGTPGKPGTPSAPGVTPGPTPHRGRGRPRKHPLPGTPGGPPVPVPRKKKEKPVKPPSAAASAPSTPSAPGAIAVSQPSLPPSAAVPGQQTQSPPPPSPVTPSIPEPSPGHSGEMISSTLQPTIASMRPPASSPPSNAVSSIAVRPPTMHPTLTSATSLNTPRATPRAKSSPSPAPQAARPAAAAKKTPAKANGTIKQPATQAARAAPAPAPTPAAPAASDANPSIPNHPIPLLIPVASLPRLSALGIQPTPSPHIRPVIGRDGQPQGLQGAPVAIDPAQSVPAVLLGISEGTAEASADGVSPGGNQQILHISVVLSRLSPSQLSGLAVLMQSLQAQVEAGKRK